MLSISINPAVPPLLAIYYQLVSEGSVVLFRKGGGRHVSGVSGGEHWPGGSGVGTVLHKGVVRVGTTMQVGSVKP